MPAQYLLSGAPEARTLQMTSRISEELRSCYNLLMVHVAFRTWEHILLVVFKSNTYCLHSLLGMENIERYKM